MLTRWKVIEIDAVGSRTKENGGCLRFDVLRDPNKSNSFTFYEVLVFSYLFAALWWKDIPIKVYKDQAALQYHKASEHYQDWTNFKASGAVLAITVKIFDAISFTGGIWWSLLELNQAIRKLKM